MNLQKKYKMKVVKIKIENEIDFIPRYNRNRKAKYFEFKILFATLIIEGLF